MNPKESKHFIDSSAWLSYFFAENQGIKEIIDKSNMLLTSVISLFEIKRKLMRDNVGINKVSSILNFIKEKSIITKIDQDICENAAEISVKEKLHAIDSLIYTSSNLSSSIFVTGNGDFRKIRNVILIK